MAFFLVVAGLIGSVLPFYCELERGLNPELFAVPRDALALFDIRVVDHIIVGGTEVLSFAERRLL